MELIKSGGKARLNEFCRNKTKGKIDNIFTEDTRKSETYLVSASYFEGKWATPFDDSHRNIFNTEHNVKGYADFMVLENINLKFFLNDKVTAVRLPYEDDGLQMDVYMPENSKLMDNPDFFDTYTKNLNNATSGMCTVYLPKWSTEKTIDLIDDMKKLGIKELFTPYTANMSKMVVKQSSVNKMNMAIKIDVDMNGTEASAVSYARLEGDGCDDTFRPVLNFNKPFAYVIHDKSNAYFSGIIMDPSIRN